MSVNVGSAVGYLDLDIKGFLSSLREVQDAASENMQKVKKTFSDQLNGIADKCNSWGKSLSLSVTTPLAAMGGTLLKFGMDFESAMMNVKAITQMTDEELKTLKEGIFDVSRVTGISSIELANQVKMVAESGGDLNLVMEQLTHGANLAIATETDLATTLDMVGSSMKTFGLEAEDTQRVVDSLASVTTMANTTLSDLNSAYVNVGGIAAQTGVSIDEVNAILVELANAGLKGGAAGTSLAGVLRNLSAPTDKAKCELENLGIALYDNNGASRNMMEIMQELQNVLSGMTDEQRAQSESIIFDTVSRKAWLTMTGHTIELSEEMIGVMDSLGIAINDSNGEAREMADIMEELHDILPSLTEEQQLLAENVLFGEEAFGAWATTTEGGIESIVALADELSNAGDEFDGLGQAAGMMKTQTDTTAMSFKKLWNELQILGTMFVEVVGPAIKEFLEQLQKWLQWLGKLGPEWHAFIIAVGAFAGVIGPVLLGLGTLIKTFTSLLVILPKLKIAFTGLWAAITGPIGLVVLAIAGLGFAIWYFWDDIKEVCQGIKILWNEFSVWFMDKMKAFGNWIAETWTACWTNVSNFFVNTCESIKSTFSSIVQSMMTLGRNIVDGIWRGIQNSWSTLVNGFYDLARRTLPKVLRDALGIGSPSKLMADMVGKWIPPGITKGFSDAMPQAVKDMQRLIDSGVGRLATNNVTFDYGLVPTSPRTDSGQHANAGVAGQQNTGGNTYNFYSPEPITEAQARRELEQLSRNMAFGF